MSGQPNPLFSSQQATKRTHSVVDRRCARPQFPHTATELARPGLRPPPGLFSEHPTIQENGHYRELQGHQSKEQSIGPNLCPACWFRPQAGSEPRTWPPTCPRAELLDASIVLNHLVHALRTARPYPLEADLTELTRPQQPLIPAVAATTPRA
ncbi:hypothetical protein GCM10007147_10590 [Nocardiopsis kunsanensis]|uniref:Uncharacterized protein n=1 Tax=Nocardiopsis kunsanensis TaxID=141693 RepID=A0A918X9V9_9ACTN|nr:hypothetical protein GCM10007147_10590 [Nocardiopsis kunsanensis]